MKEEKIIVKQHGGKREGAGRKKTVSEGAKVLPSRLKISSLSLWLKATLYISSTKLSSEINASLFRESAT